jgi:hypothetical protein
MDIGCEIYKLLGENGEYSSVDFPYVRRCIVVCMCVCVYVYVCVCSTNHSSQLVVYNHLFTTDSYSTPESSTQASFQAQHSTTMGV